MGSFELNKSKQIMYKLLAELKNPEWKPHRQLPTDRDLAAKFQTTVVTIRKAMNFLVKEGVIYRKERKGSFVSPNTRVGQILLVTPPWWDPSMSEFMRGSTQAIMDGDLGMLLVPVPFSDFMARLPQVEVYYRDILCVLFFRDWNRFAQARPVLDTKGIPAAFYGSDLFEKRIRPGRAVFYQEADIVDLAFRHFQAKGVRTCAVVSSEAPAVSRRRAELFLSGAKDWGFSVPAAHRLAILDSSEFGGRVDRSVIDPEGGWHPETVRPAKERRCRAWMERFRGGKTAIFATTDHLATRVLRLAYEMKISVPGELLLLGVDDMEYLDLLPVSLSSVKIDTFADGRALVNRMVTGLQGGEETFRIASAPRLVVRDT